MHHILHLIRLIPGYRGRFVRVLAANVLLGLSLVATPYLFKQIVDSIAALAQHPSQSAAAQSSIVVALIILGSIRLVSVAFSYFQQRATDLLFMETMWGLRRQIFRHLTTLSVDYYEQHRVGEIVQRVSNATLQLRVLLQQWAEGSLLSLLTLVFIITVLLVKLPLIGLLMLIMTPAMIGSAIYRVHQTQPLQRQWTKQAEKTMGTLSETISLIATVRSFGQDHQRVAQFDRETADFMHLRTQHFRVEWRLNTLQNAIVALTSLTALTLVAFGALAGRYTAGDILLVLTYVQMIITNIGPIVRLIINTGEVEIASERVVELLKTAPTVVDQPGAQELERLESIEFRQVSFRYPGKDRWVLEEVSFTVTAGQTLALVGPSGVGKTTITKLLLRFYEPTAGQILVNDRPIGEFTQNSIRRQLGMVMQEVALFNDTVEANLRFVRPEATVAQLAAAADGAHAADFIKQLPDGYQTLVGERGVRLSGGEKQRLAIARAILRDPQLVILDEATSALDSESERAVQAGLKRLLEGRTAIIIAHRLSTVRQADQIVVLQQGRITEHGTHAELAQQRGGLYARLLKLQASGVLAD